MDLMDPCAFFRKLQFYMGWFIPSVFVLIDSAGHTGVVLLCCEISIRKYEVKDIEWKLSWN